MYYRSLLCLVVVIQSTKHAFNSSPDSPRNLASSSNNPDVLIQQEKMGLPFGLLQRDENCTRGQINNHEKPLSHNFKLVICKMIQYVRKRLHQKEKARRLLYLVSQAINKESDYLEKKRIRRDKVTNATGNPSSVNSVNLTSHGIKASKTDQPMRYDTKSILTWTRHYATNSNNVKKRRPQPLSLTGATIGGIILLLAGVVVVYFIWRLKNKERSHEESGHRIDSTKRDETEMETSFARSSPV